MKDIKYIIKRVIIGVGIALSLMFIKGNLAYVVNAESINFTPNDIVVVTSSSNTPYQAELNFWADEYVYAFPTTVPVDWQGFANIYFRYSQFNGSSYCSGTSNNGSISGNIYNGLQSANVGSVVRLEDRINNTYNDCQTSVNGAKVSFNCQNVNLSHSLNILISNANGGRYGISRSLNINCSMTNEGMANSINNNNNNNTNRIINSQNEIKNEITDSDVTGANSSANSFFNNFSSNNHGLSGIISSPLRLIQSITSSSCTSLNFPLPFVNHQVSIPCMSSIYTTYFNDFLTIYRIITTGLIGYWVVLNLFRQVKGFQDPDSSKVEVFDL